MTSIKDALKNTGDTGDNASTFDGFFFLLLTFALGVRLFQTLETQVIEPDSCTIIEVARTFGNLRSLSLEDFAVNVHPLFPFLMALFSKLGIGYEAAGKGLSILFGTLTLFPVYLMAKGTYGRTVGRYSAFLFAIHPYLFIDASNVLRDSMAIFFVVMTFFVAWKAFEQNKDRYLVLSGCMAALAYLTKAEGLFCIAAVFCFIWMRDPRFKEITLGRRVRSTVSFASVSLTMAVCLIILFSIKSGAFTLSVTKSISSGYQPPGVLSKELTAMGGASTGLPLLDMALAFILEFFEAIFAVYILLLVLNLVRLWAGKRLVAAERYYLFIIVTLLVLDFTYFGLFHIFSRRYFLTVVVLLMGFMGYGMRLLQALATNLLSRTERAAFLLRPLMVLFVIGMIALGLAKGSYYWENKKASLKVTGRYILSHFGAGRTILSDDPRIAYYADGSYVRLTEDALIEAIKRPAGSCPYDFIAIYYGENRELYKQYETRIRDAGFADLAIPVPAGTKGAIVVECPGRR